MQINNWVGIEELILIIANCNHILNHKILVIINILRFNGNGFFSMRI